MERFQCRDIQGWFHPPHVGHKPGCGLLRRWENHAGQEACPCRGFGFVHDALEVFFHGVFAQIHAVGDFLVGEAEHEVDDDHLFPFGQAIELLNVCVWALEPLMKLFDDDEQPAVPCQRLVGDAESANEQLLVLSKTKALDLDALAIFGMFTREVWIVRVFPTDCHIATFTHTYTGNLLDV